MPDHPQKPELDNEHRYAALLALTSQELPAKPPNGNADTDGTNVNSLANQQDEALFKKLDADPAALESFLRRERQRQTADESNKRSPLQWLAELFTAPTFRYAAAFGIATFVAVVALLVNRDPRLIDAIEQSYAHIQFAPAQELLLPWERQPAVGFAPAAGNDSRAAIEFARGLVRGKQKISAAAIPAIESSYAALGEWNVLLWSASQGAPLPPEFWRGQLHLSQQLSATSYDDSEAAAAIATHLQKVSGLLDALARGEGVARNARTLTDELLLFREQFAPHDPAVLSR